MPEVPKVNESDSNLKALSQSCSLILKTKNGTWQKIFLFVVKRLIYGTSFIF